jgi:AhpD family alkylhydroperoxidase
MMNNWNDTLSNLRKAGSNLATANTPVINAYRALNEAVANTDVLDAKTRELICLAVAVTTRCDGCISSHSAAAQKAGATREEVAAALGTAIAMNAGAAFVYSSRALEAFDQFGS